MYQIGTKWKLWELENVFQNDVGSITLRGYNQEAPVALPGDFLHIEKRLSVERIASEYCPTRRDVYLEIKQGVKQRSENRTWGQKAGPLIEEYCKGLLAYFGDLAKAPDGLHYKKIQELAEKYTNLFWKEHEKKINDLGKIAANPEETPERLVFLLQQTAKYELSLLGADYEFNENLGQEFVPLIEKIPIRFDSATLTIVPNSHLGLSKTTTPDFILSSLPVMGEVKSGPNLKLFHLTTIAGYALAYESQYEKPVDFGVIYFFETHTKQMNFAQSYVFLIDDILRKQFLVTRDRLYALLLSEDTPNTLENSPKDYEFYCKRCKYHAKCYPGQ